MSDPVLHHVLFYDYVENVVERRAPFREAHLAVAREWKDDGRIVMAGALGKPPTGALFVFLVDDPARDRDVRRERSLRHQRHRHGPPRRAVDRRHLSRRPA